jgi:hypothetical protein
MFVLTNQDVGCDIGLSRHILCYIPVQFVCMCVIMCLPCVIILMRYMKPRCWALSTHLVLYTCAVCLHVRDHVPAVRHHPDALHEAEPGRQRRDYTEAHTGM